MGLLAISVIFVLGVLIGRATGYDKGLSDGVTVNRGDKWDCAYSYSTGFRMCDRTPKYK